MRIRIDLGLTVSEKWRLFVASAFTVVFLVGAVAGYLLGKL